MAGTARHHTLYIWDKASGNLVKILSGQKGEMLLDVVVRKEGMCYVYMLFSCFSGILCYRSSALCLMEWSISGVTC